MQIKRDEKDLIINEFIIKNSIINNNDIIINKNVNLIDNNKNVLQFSSFRNLIFYFHLKIKRYYKKDNILRGD